MRVFLEIGLRILVLPVVIFLYFVKKFLVIEFVLPNVTLFGHLALEPEKILSKIQAEDQQLKRKPKRILIWSFSKSRYQVNKTLVQIWRREVTSLPSMIVDAIYRTGKLLPNFEIKILQFDKLHENDHVIDTCDSHLKFSRSEVQLGEDYLRSVGVKPGEPYICLVVREAAWAPPKTGPSSSGTLRSRSFEDFLPAAQALAELDVTVIKLGAAGTFQTTGSKIVDYANSESKSEFLDVYLPSHAKCVISTMSGPDAVALAGRVPVLYVDIAQYSLCFAGTSLVTWVPALLYSQKLGRLMTMSEVFDSGAGRFLGSTAFELAGINVMQSSPEKISEYCVAFYKNLVLPSYESDQFQRQYRNKFHALLSRNSVAKLEPLNSSLSVVFLKQNGEAFLA